MPLTGVNNQFNNFETQKLGSAVGFPMSDLDNKGFTGAEDNNQQNQFKPNRRPTSGSLKDMQTKYPELKDQINGSDDQEIKIGSPSLSNEPGKDVAKFDSVTGAPLAGKTKQTSNKRPKGNRRPGISGNSQIQKNRPKDRFFTQESTGAPSISDYIKNAAKQPNSNQYGTQQDENGYHYQTPNTEFSQTKFPSRFNPQELSSTMKPDQRRNEFAQGTTRKPFITPNVYNQDGTRQSTTRRPFTGVTSPTKSSYTDYDDGDDYPTDKDIDDENTIHPAGKSGNTSRPNQSTQTTSIPQYSPGGQRKGQKGTVTPGRRNDHSGTITPGYTLESTTPMPSHSLRFGSTETSRREKPQQRRPTSNVPGSTAVGTPVTTQIPSGSRPSDYRYQTTGPVSGYSGSNLVPGYTSNNVVPSLGSVSSTPDSSNPSQRYSSTTVVSPTFGYDLDSGSLIPSRTLGASQPLPSESFHTGYHYGPPKSSYSTTVSPNSERLGSNFFATSGNPEISQTSAPGTYQTDYQPGNSGKLGTSPTAGTTGRPGNFILSQPGSSAPEYQANYPNGPSTPDYTTTVASSTPGASPVYEYPGSFGASNPRTPGYEYGTSKPSYSTTPGSIVTSGMPSQSYTTTYRPGYQTIQETNVGGRLVDGFGRPITTDQGGSYPGFSQPGQGSSGPFYQGTGLTGPSTVSPSGNRPVDNSSPGYGSTEATQYPGSNDQSRVVGEDFSGPKQPQRFDPKTGYHYK